MTTPLPDTGRMAVPGLRIPRWLKLPLSLAIILASLYFLGSRLARDWHQIPFHSLRIRPLLVAVSFAVLIVTHLPLYGYAWMLILRALGTRLSALKAAAIMSVAQIGKYAPGKVWFTLGRMSMARAEGVPQDRTLVSVIVELGFAMIASLLLLGIAVLLVPRSQVPPVVYLLFLLAPLSLVACCPPILNRILRYALARFGRPAFELKLSYSGTVRIVAVYTLDWALQGFGSYLLISSFYPLPLQKLAVLIGGYAVSWMVGFIVLIVPAGLGVREGIYAIILRTVMPEPIAILSALLTRVWMTIGDLLMAGISLPVIARRRKRGEEKEPPTA